MLHYSPDSWARSEGALQARPRADSDRAAGQSSIGFQPVFCSR